jgi:transposase
MRYRARPLTIPQRTKEVAQAAFAKGNVYLTMREELGIIYQDDDFAEMFSHAGKPAEAPGNLALVLVMQKMESLTDRQAADAVRGRIDWKYALGLELEDEGFDQSVLNRFRQRLIDNEGEREVLERILVCVEKKGLLDKESEQRTDATYVLAVTRELNRLELVAETMRHTLEAVARADGEWLGEWVPEAWFKRYGTYVEEYRLPKRKRDRAKLAQQIGTDGQHLLDRVADKESPKHIKTLAAIEAMSLIWQQQYRQQKGQLKWRDNDDLPPANQKIQNPHDIEARYAENRGQGWVGFKVHLTETCATQQPRLITQVLTTPATLADVKTTTPIQDDLIGRGYQPKAHYVDAGYVEAEVLAKSKTHKIDLIGPTLSNNSWQARAAQGYALTDFDIDWQAEVVICPEGKHSASWWPMKDRQKRPVIDVRFRPQDCRPCSARLKCTRATARYGRALKLYPQQTFLALEQARLRQQDPNFWQQYKRRAGIEGTISQGVRQFQLRRSRVIGLTKTHLQHILVAAAMNISRTVAWLRGDKLAATRESHFLALAPT